MSEQEYQRPEGRLLANAMASTGRSARNVASKIGISDTRLRHIVNGYQPMGGGQKIAVVGPAETVARAARELEISGQQLRRAGRPDAAEALERLDDIDRLVRHDYRALVELKDYIVNVYPKGVAPEAAMFIFKDEQLLNELRRRLNDVSETVALSDPADTPELAIAAHEDGDIAGETETRNDP